jgi:hypothetical protein
MTHPCCSFSCEFFFSKSVVHSVLCMLDLEEIYLEEKVVYLVMGQVCHVHSFKVNLVS